MPLTIPEYITVKTAAGATVAYLSLEADGLKDTWVNNELNGRCTLNLSLPLLSEKWQYLSNFYRVYAPDITGKMREFVIQNPDAVERKREGKKLWGKVTAHESWVLLGKKYITVSNDPQTPDPPPLAVIILSGGSDLSGGLYTPGSAGHALFAVLQGTGWSVGTVDITGTHDLETEKISVLKNIKEIQKKWGGYLVWDSINKTVSLRSEETWAPYTGYQIRYAKNLKSITRNEDTDIVTKLYPFGADDLDISSVNGGQLYIENYSYTSEALEEIWINQDIQDSQKLKDEAQKHLAKVCKPRYNYRVKQVDLRMLPGYQHEDFDIGHMVDVIDEDLGINIQARAIGYKYNVFQPWQCELEVGDPIEKLDSLLADSKESADYIKKILRPNAGVSNILKGIINTLATEINDSKGTYTLVDGVSTWFERDVDGNLTGNLLRITPEGLIISSDGGQNWDLAISGTGGVNASVVRTGVLSASVVQVGAATTYESGYDPTTKLGEGKIYNGIKIDTTNGFIATKSDNKTRIIANATDGIKIQTSEDGVIWNDKFYVDTSGNLNLKGNLKVTDTFGVDAVYGIWVGNSNPNLSPFKVTIAGNLTANNATIQGNIDCSSLKLNGVNILDAVDGKITASGLTSEVNANISKGVTTRSYFDENGNLINDPTPDWVSEWNNGTTTVTDGYILAPKLYAGIGGLKAQGVLLDEAGIKSYLEGLQTGYSLENDGKIYLRKEGIAVGEFSWDDLGQAPDNPRRVWIKSLTGYALKIESGGNMSIAPAEGGKIYLGNCIISSGVDELKAVRNVVISPNDPDPAQMNNGEIWLKYTP